MSTGFALLSAATVGSVFVGNGLWSLLPAWRPEVTTRESVRVEGPVSDSVVASVECNCHCPPPDNLPLIAGYFLAGSAAALLAFCVIRCWRLRAAEEREQPEPRVTRYYSPLPSTPAARLAVEDLPEPRPRKTAVTPSNRRR